MEKPKIFIGLVVEKDEKAVKIVGTNFGWESTGEENGVDHLNLGEFCQIEIVKGEPATFRRIERSEIVEITENRVEITNVPATFSDTSGPFYTTQLFGKVAVLDRNPKNGGLIRICPLDLQFRRGFYVTTLWGGVLETEIDEITGIVVRTRPDQAEIATKLPKVYFFVRESLKIGDWIRFSFNLDIEKEPKTWQVREFEKIAAPRGYHVENMDPLQIRVENPQFLHGEDDAILGPIPLPRGQNTPGIVKNATVRFGKFPCYIKRAKVFWHVYQFEEMTSQDGPEADGSLMTSQDRLEATRSLMMTSEASNGLMTSLNLPEATRSPAMTSTPSEYRRNFPMTSQKPTMTSAPSGDRPKLPETTRSPAMTSHDLPETTRISMTTSQASKYLMTSLNLPEATRSSTMTSRPSEYRQNFPMTSQKPTMTSAPSGDRPKLPETTRSPAMTSHDLPETTRISMTTSQASKYLMTSLNLPEATRSSTMTSRPSAYRQNFPMTSQKPLMTSAPSAYRPKLPEATRSSTMTSEASNHLMTSRTIPEATRSSMMTSAPSESLPDASNGSMTSQTLPEEASPHQMTSQEAPEDADDPYGDYQPEELHFEEKIAVTSSKLKNDPTMTSAPSEDPHDGYKPEEPQNIEKTSSKIVLDFLNDLKFLEDPLDDVTEASEASKSQMTSSKLLLEASNPSEASEDVPDASESSEDDEDVEISRKTTKRALVTCSVLKEFGKNSKKWKKYLVFLWLTDDHLQATYRSFAPLTPGTLFEGIFVKNRKNGWKCLKFDRELTSVVSFSHFSSRAPLTAFLTVFEHRTADEQQMRPSTRHAMFGDISDPNCLLPTNCSSGVKIAIQQRKMDEIGFNWVVKKVFNTDHIDLFKLFQTIWNRPEIRKFIELTSNRDFPTLSSFFDLNLAVLEEKLEEKSEKTEIGDQYAFTTVCRKNLARMVVFPRKEHRSMKDAMQNVTDPKVFGQVAEMKPFHVYQVETDPDSGKVTKMTDCPQFWTCDENGICKFKFCSTGSDRINMRAALVKPEGIPEVFGKVKFCVPAGQTIPEESATWQADFRVLGISEDEQVLGKHGVCFSAVMDSVQKVETVQNLAETEGTENAEKTCQFSTFLNHLERNELNNLYRSLRFVLRKRTFLDLLRKEQFDVEQLEELVTSSMEAMNWRF